MTNRSLICTKCRRITPPAGRERELNQRCGEKLSYHDHGCDGVMVPVEPETEPPSTNSQEKTMNEQACKTPPQPEGRVVARTVKVIVSETLDLHTGYAREGWCEYLWLSGWRARIAVFVLKLLR